MIQAKKKGVLAQIAKGKGGKTSEEDAAKKYAFVKQFVLDGASVDMVCNGLRACLSFSSLFMCAHCLNACVCVLYLFMFVPVPILMADWVRTDSR